MEPLLYIDKTRKLPQDKDYYFLRAEGLKYIEKLGSSVWTDYNTHDPGITILETLCYAITELGYRTDFNTKDLLAAEDGSIDQDQAFFTAKNILTAAPLTVEDYRKLLVDIVGVSNAWLYPYRDEDNTMVGEPDQEVPLFANCKKDILTYHTTDHSVRLHGLYRVVLDLEVRDEFGDLNNGNLFYQFAVEALLNVKFQLFFPNWNEIDYEFTLAADPSTITNISVDFANEHWDVSFDISGNGETHTIEFKSFILLRADISDLQASAGIQFNDPAQLAEIFLLYQKKIATIIDILTDAKNRLHAHRNLCEDYLPLETVCTQEVAFCADIEVSPDTDIEKVYAQVLFELENYLNPEVKFYTLKELVEDGVPSEQIFEGPILKHGFIKTGELKATQIRSQILVSDIINFIMDIEGVKAVKNVLITKYDADGKPVLPSERWCLKISGGCKPVLNIFRSKVLFFKGKLPFRAKQDETLDTLKFLHGLERRNKLKGTSDDYPMPKGSYRNLEDFLSIQNEFPMTYGIGKFGLRKSVSAKRQAQARQLKAYLRFFDQVLANFFSQMAHARKLFSLDPDIKQTYFGQYLDEVKDIEEIYINPADLKKVLSAPDPTDSIEIKQARPLLFENQDQFYQRRNRFLDHLIARFAETFNEYVLMLYSYKNADEYDEIDAEELINDKIAFLRDYPIISRERGQAFNYLQPAWDTNNVSGLEKRLARLAGIDDFTRRFLFCLKTIEIQKTEDTPPGYFFQVVDEAGETIIKSTKTYDSYPEIVEVSFKLSGVLGDPAAYLVKDIAADQFSFEVVDTDDNVLAESGIIYPSAVARDEGISEFIEKLADDCPEEGMHLVEHILLRPGFDPPEIAGEELEDTYKLFTVCLGENCQFCGEEDPYSFRITLVLPYWHERFQSMEFRRYFETMVRSETPAHCMIKICWLDNTHMNAFEVAYKAWMEALADYQADLILKESKQEALRLASNEMIEILSDLHSEYPEARLHDCDEGTTNPVLLNNTILGTYKI